MAGAAFLASFEQQLEPFFPSVQEALVLLSHPDFASLEHYFLVSDFAG